jgi:TctA family transporter
VPVSLQNLLWCLAGAMIGTAIGVLRGLAPS